MKHDTDVRDTDSDPAAEGRKPDRQPVNTSRRRFTRAGLSASVIMTLASRPALANHCSISAGMSGNLSQQPHLGVCNGLTPGYWKMHPDEWACIYVPGMCNPIAPGNGSCTDWSHPTWGEFKANEPAIRLKDPVRPGFTDLYEDYQNWANWSAATPDASLPSPNTPPTTLNTAFAVLSFPPNQTMMQAFHEAPSETLLTHAMAALLNVCRFGEEQFGYTRNGLLSFINNWTGTDEALKNALEDLNQRGVN